ncbi:hypothetical protein [Halomonas caseinilytica]|uniref:hypothetical protein n=1 Tax=Halomonas caseinilytica TaxID=438744 RepID=UPI0007E53676|nr:hypothetical protein [Halomonas caseinilytica]SEM10510.1 hypothetical protein SAMN04487952_101419 [Halomonas caseinilytica]
MAAQAQITETTAQQGVKTMQHQETNNQSQDVPRDHLEKMKYVPTPISVKALTCEKAAANKAKARADYLEKRERLAAASQELSKLQKTLNALQEQGKIAEKAWKQVFVTGLGRQSKEVREQQKQQTQWRLEAEQHEEMIKLIEPQVEWLQIHTNVARQTYRKACRDEKEVRAYSAMLESVKGLTTSEHAAMLRESLGPLFEQIADDTCNNAVFMAQFNVDVNSEPGQGIFSYLSQGDTRTVKQEIERRQLAAVGELFLSQLDKNQTQRTQDDAEELPVLGCEATHETMQSSASVARRLRELEAQMEYLPH